MRSARFNHRGILTIAALFGVLCRLPVARAELLSSVTFDNESGEVALVKLVGPTPQAIEVPDRQLRSVKVAAGKYYILVRYAVEPDKYRYTKGEPFDVEEKETATGTQYSQITITLHRVVAGNYSTASSSKEEFEKAAIGETSSKEKQRLPDDLVELRDTPYASLEGLAPGSAKAQQRQKDAVQSLGLPLEVRARKTGIILRLIPAGSFTSARHISTEYVHEHGINGYSAFDQPHHVRLTKAFYCGKFEVTQAQWEAVMGNNPSKFKNAGKDAPVELVSWGNCQIFLRKVCELEGVPEGTYRFLTDAQWEFACRAGTQTASYSNSATLDPIAWYYDNSVDLGEAYDSHGRPIGRYAIREGTHPVGKKNANAFGLHDMIGNVREWCKDYHAWHTSAAVSDPSGPPWGRSRVVRGGSWSDKGCSTSRDGYGPGERKSNLGLRLSRTLPSEL